jgi:hypothetical protein
MQTIAKWIIHRISSGAKKDSGLFTFTHNPAATINKMLLEHK